MTTATEGRQAMPEPTPSKTPSRPPWYRRWFGGGDLVEVRERHQPHLCRVPGPFDDLERYVGDLGDGARWRCRRCGSVWELSNYHAHNFEWFRREDPTYDEFLRTHDDEGRPITSPQSPPSRPEADRG